MCETIDRIISALYYDDIEQTMSLILQSVAQLGAVPGVEPWINPMFDALDRGDYLYAADIFCYELRPLVA